MRKFIKAVSFVLLFTMLLAFSASLSSCHGAKGDIVSFDIPDSFDSSKKYEITFWAKNDSNVTQANIYKDAINDFQAIYPNITVTMKPYTDYGRIYNDVITNIPTGTTPNVCISYPDHIATYITGENVVVPLDTLMRDEKYGFGGSEVKFDAPKSDEIVDKFLEEGKIGGIQYAVPFMRSTEACYVNRDYVEKLGFTLPETLTWDFIFEVSAAAMEKNSDGTFKVNGKKVLIPFIYKSTDNMMIQMLKQRGAGYSNDKGEILIFNDDTEQILYAVADSVEKKAFSTFKISSYPGNYFNAGECIFAIDSTAGASWMGTNAPNSDIHENKIVDFKTEVMTIPQYDVENPQMISQGPSLCIFNKENPDEVIASWLFVQFLLTNKVQIAYAQTEGYVPVTKKAQTSPEYLDYLSRAGEDNELYYDVKLAATKLLIDNTENTFVTPVFNGSASLRNAAGQMIENVAKSVRRGEKVDSRYIEQLYGDVKALYRLDEVSVSGGAAVAELGPMPTTSIVLISALAAVWLLIGTYFVWQLIKKRKVQKI